MQIIHSTNTPIGILVVAIFAIAYLIVILEEFLNLRKCKPMIFAAGMIWVLIAILAKQQGLSHIVVHAIKQNILEYSELLLFLLCAMTYVNVMLERKVFASLHAWLTNHGFSLRQLFWITGTLAFFISPLIDNLTTALVMGAVITAIGKDQPKFMALSCINVVVAANAGGAFSPFGDITTLMVWQKNILQCQEFFALFIPALVSYLIPALVMSFAIPSVRPEQSNLNTKMAVGAKRVILLFLLTITTAVGFYYYLALPPVIGMMTGLSYLAFFDYYLKINPKKSGFSFNILQKVAEIEWDTLLFFYGIMLCVGGLATIGYLEYLANTLYLDLDWGLNLSAMYKQTPANITIGLLSAIIDNIPIMFGLLTMSPEMSKGQWLLVTLTAGIGGSLLSIGSAAGVALMGQSRGAYTFFSHLKWSWIILVGYCAGIWAHILLNKAWF